MLSRQRLLCLCSDMHLFCHRDTTLRLARIGCLLLALSLQNIAIAGVIGCIGRMVLAL